MRHYTAELPGTGGAMKTVPEDFVVEEIPAYTPSGVGQHVYLLVEKRGITTHEMVRRLAQHFGVAGSDVGTAGQKDRQAIARQVVSVPGVDPMLAANVKLDGIEVLSAARHGNKLRTGHLRGNRFTIVVRGVGPDADRRARAILDALISTWVPNRYGAQRFGMRGTNADEGRALLRGDIRVADRFKKRLLLSAFQAHLFNRFLEERIEEGLLHRAIVGDVMQRTQTGGLFVVEPQELAFAQSRLEMRQIVPTGPIFGHSMFAPAAGSAAAAREQRVLDEESVRVDEFARFGRLAEGTRRPLLVRIEGTSVRQVDDQLIVSFALPAGAYATVVMDEIMKPGERAPASEADGGELAAGEAS